MIMLSNYATYENITYEKGACQLATNLRSTLLSVAIVAIGISGALVFRHAGDGQQVRHSASFSSIDLSVLVDPAINVNIASTLPTLSRPPLRDIDKWRDWQTTLREQIKTNVYEISAGDFSVPEPVVTLGAELVESNLKRVDLLIPASNGHQIPATLLLPNSAGNLPGIIVIPGHVKDGESGLEQMTRKTPSYHNSAALRLAEAGFATLTIELRGFGVLGPPAFPNHQIVAYNSLLAGHFYKKLAVQDTRYALEYLLSRNDIDSSRVGMTGVSLGGELAVAYAGLDERVKAVAFHSYGGAVGQFSGISSNDSAIPHYCHIVPGSSRLYMQEDPILLLAPRPTLATRGVERPFSRPAFFDTLNETWEALGFARNIEVVNLKGQSDYSGHAYFVDEAVTFFSDNL